MKYFDYSSNGNYFVTICTHNRIKTLSTIVNDGVVLTKFGEIAEKYINQLNEFYDDRKVDRYVIMPNHIHIMLFIMEDGSSRTPNPTRQNSVVSQFVSTLKRFCNKEYGKNIWQKYFHDHIIRNRKDYEEHIKYIHENPANWYYDELYDE